MAKKIIISFSAQPITTGVGWSYNIKANGINIPYNSGVIDCEINFRPTGTTQTVNIVAVGANLAETLTITLAHLRAFYVNSAIDYNIVGNTIEVLINADVDIVVSATINANIIITQSEVEPNFLNLKYFLIYGDYRLNILQKNYLGFSTEIFGAITINKGSVETILEPIRGTGISLSLEANSALTFDEFGLADEFTYKTELSKNNQIIFKGYIKPDGIQQSYVNDEWLVNVESVDGLGLLKDLSFVQNNGLTFTGRLSMYDVIKGCLNRTGLVMQINTSIEIEYNGYTGTNILKNVYVNSERFIKAENDPVIMDCNEVLTSVLNLFSGVITQEDGQWYVYRPNDLVLNGYVTFINQETNATFTKNLTKVLGSQIDNFYPHHCDGNQQIEMKGAISAYRLNYEYGFLDGLILNKNLTHNTSLVFPNWTVISSTYIVNDPLDTQGLILISDTTTVGPVPVIDIIESNLFTAKAGDVLKLNTDVFTTGGKHYVRFKLETSDGKYMNADGVWTTDPNVFFKGTAGSFGGFNNTSNFTFTTQPVINDCTIILTICRPVSLAISTFQELVEITKIDVTELIAQASGVVGEFHTVSRKSPPSSITKENQTVFNGDGTTSLIGTIYKDDNFTATKFWSRKNKFESYPLLRISAEDDLRIQPNPIKVFSGGIFGQIPYLSVVTINNVLGLFMFTEYSYDIQTNKINGKLTQFYNSDLGDLQYSLDKDYGNNTIKPTIKG